MNYFTEIIHDDCNTSSSLYLNFPCELCLSTDLFTFLNRFDISQSSSSCHQSQESHQLIVHQCDKRVQLTCILLEYASKQAWKKNKHERMLIDVFVFHFSWVSKQPNMKGSLYIFACVWIQNSNQQSAKRIDQIINT